MAMFVYNENNNTKSEINKQETVIENDNTNDIDFGDYSFGFLESDDLFFDNIDPLDAVEMLREFEIQGQENDQEDNEDEEFTVDDEPQENQDNTEQETQQDEPENNEDPEDNEDEEFTMDDDNQENQNQDDVENNNQEDNTNTEDEEQEDDENFEIPDDEQDNDNQNQETQENDNEEDEEFTMDDDNQENQTGEEQDQEDNGLSLDTNQDSKLKELEVVVFDNLSDAEKKAKIKELKNLYILVYDKCGTILDSITDVKKDEEVLQIIEYISNTLIDLKQYVNDYINDVFESKTYMENLSQLQKYIMIFNAINKVFDQIKQENNK